MTGSIMHPILTQLFYLFGNAIIVGGHYGFYILLKNMAFVCATYITLQQKLCGNSEKISTLFHREIYLYLLIWPHLKGSRMNIIWWLVHLHVLVRVVLLWVNTHSSSNNNNLCNFSSILMRFKRFEREYSYAWTPIFLAQVIA